MELGLCLDDDFHTEETKKDKPKEKPYNVKICERQWIFKSPTCSNKVEKQNITKFRADVWYRDGQYLKALKSYKFIQENPQVSSSTVTREIDESVARCHFKLEQFDEAVHVIQNMLKDHGDDTSLILMLANTCAATGNIQGEIACIKRCISIHSYNHHFWYSLALAYRKAFEDKGSSNCTATSPNGVISNNELINKVAEALAKSKTTKTTNHKDSLKIFINCQHCKCLREMDFEKNCPKASNEDNMTTGENGKEFSKEEVLDCSDRSSLVPVVDEIVLFMEELSIDNEHEIAARTDDSLSHNFLKSKEDTKDIETSDLHGLNQPSGATSVQGNVQNAAEDHGSCSFSVKLKSSTYSQPKAKQMCNKMALKDQDQLKLFAFFCLIRARFHLQRAIWISSSFIEERLADKIAEVNERIDKFEPCKCGELKKCCLKFMSQGKESAADITSEQMDE